MEHVIIGFSDRNKGEVVKDIVVKNGFLETTVCVSGDELIRAANLYDGGIIICGYKVGGMIHTEILELLPEGYGMLLLLSPSQAELVYNEDIFSLVLPVNKNDLVKTVNMVLELGERSAVKNKKSADVLKPQRSGSDRITIEKAKLYLMNKYKITEDAAHRYIQKNSMDRGLRMVETAKIILKDC